MRFSLILIFALSFTLAPAIANKKCSDWQPSKYRETEFFYMTYLGKRLNCLWEEDRIIECGQWVRISVFDSEVDFVGGIGAQSGIKRLSLVDAKGQLYFFNRKQSYSSTYFPASCSYTGTNYTTEFENGGREVLKIIWERRFENFRDGDPVLK